MPSVWPGVLAQRRTRSQEFFSRAAGQWDGLRAELFGARPDLGAAFGFLDEEWTVGDLGCGTGQFAAALAPFVRRVIAVDQSRAMLVVGPAPPEWARQRRAAVGRPRGLAYRGRRARCRRRCARPALRRRSGTRPGRNTPGAPAGRPAARRRHGPARRTRTIDSRWDTSGQGFSTDQIGGWLEEVGLKRCRYRLLPTDPRARGPGLFAATARRD